jgi:hypothetical protein
MEISQERLDFALRQLRPGDWERFERLASTFLASEWPDIRTMAAPSGDGGRDSALFSAKENANVAIQYSIAQDWSSKIRDTVKRLKETFPDVKIVVFLSNQPIGAKADDLKRKLSEQDIFLDVRDRSWFVERTNVDSNRSAGAAELARIIVDPLLESKGIIMRTASALSGQEARTALFFLEMQRRNDNAAKGLTKSSFEALARAALLGTSSSSKMTRAAIYLRVGEFLPQHPAAQLAPYVDAALRRLSKGAVQHSAKGDDFNLSPEEAERLKDRAAGIALLNEAFDADVHDIVSAAGETTEGKHVLVAELAHKIIERYFLRKDSLPHSLATYRPR